MRLKFGSRTDVVVLAAIGIVAAGGIGYAAIPGSDGQIKGCYARTNGLTRDPHSKGDLRIVDSGEGCRAYEAAIKWSQTGPAGPAGPAGDGAVVLTAKFINHAMGNGWEVIGGDAVSAHREANHVYRVVFARPLASDCVAVASPTSDDSLTSSSELSATHPEDVLISFRSLVSGEPSDVLEFGLIVAC